MDDLQIYTALTYKPGRNVEYVKKRNNIGTYDLYKKDITNSYDNDQDFMEYMDDMIGEYDEQEDYNVDLVKGFKKLELKNPSTYFNYFPSVNSDLVLYGISEESKSIDMIKQLIKQNKALLEYGCE